MSRKFGLVNSTIEMVWEKGNHNF